MDGSRILNNSFSRYVAVTLAFTSMLACQEPEPNLVWVSPAQTQYSDAEMNWQYIAEVTNADAEFYLNGGEDVEAFVVDTITGVLRFVREPEPASPQDTDGDGVYEVGLVATLDDLESPLMLRVEVLPSGSAAPHLSFPPPGSNLAIGSAHSEATLVRAEPEYRGKSLQSVSINGASAQLNDHGFWGLEVEYLDGVTELLITANYEGNVETHSTVTVENVLQEPIASDGELPLYASSAHQFMKESGVLYYLEDGYLQQRNLRTGEQQRMLGGHQFDNRIFFGVDETEESIQIIDLGSSLDYPRQTLPASESRVVTLSKLNLANADQEGEAIPIELEDNPIFSAYQFDPSSNTFLIEERLLNSTLYVEPEVPIDWPFKKLSINAANADVEEINSSFSIDTETDVGNPSPDPLGFRLSFNWLDIDWRANVLVGSACGLVDHFDIVYIKDTSFDQKWWRAARESGESPSSVCQHYGVVRNPESGKSYAAFYGLNGGGLVEIDPEKPAYRTLNPLGEVTQYADGTAVDLVHQMNVDDLNQVLYISSTEVIPLEVAEEEESLVILRDKLWSYSLISGSDSIISESIYRLRTTHPRQRINDAMFKIILDLPVN